MTQYVFVYGSLKSGHWNHSVLGGSELVAEVVTNEKYVLTDCGFPYLIPASVLGKDGPRPRTVEGELYTVVNDEVLENLDALEGVGYGHYEHHNLLVTDDEGNEYEARAYVPCDPDRASQFDLCEVNSFGEYVWRGV